MTLISRGYTPKSNPASLFPSAREPNVVGQSSSMGATTRRAAQLSAKERYEKELAALMMVAEQRRLAAQALEEERQREEEQRQKAAARQQLRQQKKIMYIAATRIQRAARRYLERRKLTSADTLRLLLQAQRRRAAVRKVATACRGVRQAMVRFTAKRRARLLLEAQRAEVARVFVGSVISHCLERKGSLLWNIKLHIYALKVQTKFRAYMRKKRMRACMAKLRRSAMAAAAFVGKLRRAVADAHLSARDSARDRGDGYVSQRASGRKRLSSSHSDPAIATRPASRHSTKTGRTTRSSMSAAVDRPVSEIERLARDDPERFKRIQELHQQRQTLSELELERRRQKIAKQKEREAEKERAAEMARMEEMLKRERHKEAFMQELLETRLQEARRYAKARALREKQLQAQQAQTAAQVALESTERELMAKEELMIRTIMREKKLAALRARRVALEQQARKTEAELLAARRKRMEELKELGQRASQQRLHEALEKEAQAREEATQKAREDAERVARFNEHLNEIRRKQIEQLRKRKEAEQREIAALLEEEGEQSITLELELEKVKADAERTRRAAGAAAGAGGGDAHQKENIGSHDPPAGSDSRSTKPRTSVLAQYDLKPQKLPRNLAPALWSSPYIPYQNGGSHPNLGSLAPPLVKGASRRHPGMNRKSGEGPQERLVDAHEDNDNDSDDGDDDDDYYEMGGGLDKMASILAMVRKARSALDLSEAARTEAAPKSGMSQAPPATQRQRPRSGLRPKSATRVQQQQQHQFPRLPQPGASSDAKPSQQLQQREPSPSAPHQLQESERRPTPQQIAYQRLLDIATAPSPDRQDNSASPTLHWRDDDDNNGSRPETGGGGGYTDEEFEELEEEEDFDESGGEEEEGHVAQRQAELEKHQTSLHLARVQLHQDASPVHTSQHRNSAVAADINLGSLDALLAQTVDEYFGDKMATTSGQ